MKVILVADVAKLGKKYETKNVKGGFGRNFLLPNKLALLATEANLQWLKQMQARAAAKLALEMESFRRSLSGLAKATVKIVAKANEKGHLFEGITKEILARQANDQLSLALDPEWIKLARPIKTLGEHEVSIDRQGVVGDLKVVIESV